MKNITNNDEETFGETLNTVMLGSVKLLRFPILIIMLIPATIGRFLEWFHKKLLY